MSDYKNIAFDDEKNLYIISFILSLIIVSAALFYSPPLEIVDSAVVKEEINIINIDKIPSPRRIVKKDISTEKGDLSDEKVVERARGTALDESAVDISFYPNVVPPKLISRIKRIYPKIARENNIEALVNCQLIISPEGKVVKVKVLGVKLLKDLPLDLYSKYSEAFYYSTVKMLLGTQFTPPVVEGKKVTIIMDKQVKFKLDD